MAAASNQARAKGVYVFSDSLQIIFKFVEGFEGGCGTPKIA